MKSYINKVMTINLSVESVHFITDRHIFTEMAPIQ